MDEYREIWQKAVRVDLGRPETLSPGTQILVGLIKNIKQKTTGKGDKIAFASLEDYNGEIELAFFSGSWEKYQDRIETGKVAILKGKIKYEKDKDKRSFTVDECLDTDEMEKVVKEEEAQARKWDKYRNVWKYAKELDLRFLDLGAPAKAEPGTYTILGVVRSLRIRPDKKGKEMAFGTLQDERGEIELVFFARTWENCKALVSVDETLALKGSVDLKNPEKSSFLVSSIQDLSRLIRTAAKKAAEEIPTEKSVDGAPEVPAKTETASPYREIHIRLAARAADDEAVLYSLKACMEGNPGACPVYIHIPASSSTGSRETVIRTAGQINAPESMGALEKCAAVADVWGT